MSEYLLEMNHICKSFPGVRALDDVTFGVRPGTVHALLGENGAGKSTLMKILIGLYKPDTGEILFDGKPLHTGAMRQVLEQGISMIYQELNPIPEMKVSENIFVGREPRLRGLPLLNTKKLTADTQELLDSLDIHNISPGAQMKTLSVAKAQMVEIAKAISYGSKLIIMDEPTSSITEKECEHLFRIVEQLKGRGVTFIFITHKMDEIYRIADEATVLRDGQFIGSGEVKALSREQLISMMVGREVNQIFPKQETTPGDTLLEVAGLSRKGEFRNISFAARRGEILGMAGLIGAGRTEVMEAIFGYRKLHGGEIRIDGKPVSIRTPADAIKNKMALLTEDRKKTGLYMTLSVQDNMVMPSLKSGFMNGPFISYKRVAAACEAQRRNFALKTPSLRQVVEKLSGGNQQKVLVSRWLLTQPEIIILDEPTRGIDVGAKADIHRFISDLAARGKCVIMISSELPEILGMSDRILVMHEGDMVGILNRDEATQERILEMATGMAG